MSEEMKQKAKHYLNKDEVIHCSVCGRRCHESCLTCRTCLEHCEDEIILSAEQWLKLHKQQFVGSDSASGAIYVMHWANAMEAYAKYFAAQETT